MKLINYIGLLFFVSCLAQGVTIGADSSTSVSPRGFISIAPAFSGANRISLRLYSGQTPSTATQMDTSCLKLSGIKVRMLRGSINWLVAISAWDQQVRLDDFRSDGMEYSLVGEIVNQCDSDIAGYIHVVAGTPDYFWSAARSIVYEIFPKMKSCSATINNLNLGKIEKGQTKKSTLVITKSGNGNGFLTMSGPDLKLDGKLRLGGNEKLQVWTTEAAYSIGPTWVSDASRNSIPLVISAASSINPGEYKSVLTAVLACD